jgi:two-component system response regulator GlrR
LKEGWFREDLYYRLNVVALQLPLLAERREDTPALASHFLRDVAVRYAKTVTALAPEAMELLVGAPWPGNVRQLQNVIEQAIALSTSAIIPASLIQSALRSEPAAWASLDEARREFERDYLVRLLRLTQGSVANAARLAQRNRTEFYKLLERHELDPKLFKGSSAA